MKILFCIHPSNKNINAGDSVQMLTTAKYLRSLDVDVFVNYGEIKDYSAYDIIHLFNLTRISETYEYFKLAKKYNKPVVITPIYWNLEKYYNYTGSEVHSALWELYKPYRSEIINGCKIVYPSSLKEMTLLKLEFGENIPCTVINNCVDTKVLTDHAPIDNDCRKNSYILCAARICPRKNQYKLAKICKDLGVELVLAGEAENRNYLNKCLQLKNVTHAGYLTGDALIKLYDNAKLHVLCSFVETPGLSNLEAGILGCNIVSTSEGSTEEYFDDMALYCNPYDDEDIYRAVKNGLNFDKQPMLRQHILNNFNLEKCLEPLYKNYFNYI